MKKIYAVAAFLVLVSCGGGSKSSSESNFTQDYIEWKSVAEEFNPTHHTQLIPLSASLESVQMNLHGFNQDVQLKYSQSLPSNKAQIEIFTVSAPVRNGVNLAQDISTVEHEDLHTNLKIKKRGNFQCYISVKNRVIEDLEGNCYARVILTLPKNAKIEVFNLGVLISSRYFPMKLDTLLSALASSTSSDSKQEAIDAFNDSHDQFEVVPDLFCYDLELILKEFVWGDEKLKALRKLHAHVMDPHNFKELIQDNFTFFDREKAERIVGIR